MTPERVKELAGRITVILESHVRITAERDGLREMAIRSADREAELSKEVTRLMDLLVKADESIQELGRGIRIYRGVTSGASEYPAGRAVIWEQGRGHLVKDSANG